MVKQENQMITNQENNLNHISRKIVSSCKPTSIIQPSKEYCVSETLVREALADIELTKLKADQRKKKQSDIIKKENDMVYTDFDSKTCTKKGKLGL